jgi:predicted AAA+ superfamily ATPase
VVDPIYIPQAQLARLKTLVAPGKVVVIYGPRRVGKTTLLRHFIAETNINALMVTGEDITVREYLASQSVAKLQAFVGHASTLIVDEAQAVPAIGVNLKLLVDHVPTLSIIASGSSSFDLARQTGEPLTGRRHTMSLLPLAQLELSAVEAPHDTRANLEQRLRFGSYPEVVLMRSDSDRERYLRELVGAYLFKDILQHEGIRKADKLTRLLQLLAFQIGKQVSLTELGGQLGMSKNTVERYLDLLEKVFVVYSRPGFSRNLRKEIAKTRRYFFVDTGIRNALINNFNLLTLRDDVGALWENYIMAERMKANLYGGRDVSSYFWRTYDHKEIDLVEEADGSLHGFEVKWPPAPAIAPSAWTQAYPKATYDVIHRENYLDFIHARPPAPG